MATDDGKDGLTGRRYPLRKASCWGFCCQQELPILNFIGDKVAVIGSPFQLTLQASDLDQQPLTFSAVGLPADATITPSTFYGQANINWVPTAAEAGVYGVTFQVTNDGNGNPALAATDQETIHLVVRASNQAPVLQNPGTQTIAEGQTLATLPLSATDPDGDSLDLFDVGNCRTGIKFRSAAPASSTLDPQPVPGPALTQTWRSGCSVKMAIRAAFFRTITMTLPRQTDLGADLC